MLPNLPIGSPKDTQIFRSRLFKMLGDYIRNDAEKYVADHVRWAFKPTLSYY